jgi:mRNA degradation ribonuclease J1/J2
MADIMSLGGSREVGRNCFYVHTDDTRIILDMGFHLEHFLELSEDEFLTSKNHTLRRFMNGGAIPDIRLLRHERKKVDTKTTVSVSKLDKLQHSLAEIERRLEQLS